MLGEYKIPRRYWAEAVNTACHVGHQTFLWAFLKKTCYELIHGRAPRVSNFQAFGSRRFILKKGKLEKFEARSSNGIFLGYANHSKSYHVLKLETNQVLETCEVTFDETQPCSSSIFDCAGDDEIGKKIFEDEEDDVGEDDGHDGEAPAMHVSSTSTMTSQVQDGPSPTPTMIQQDQVEAAVEGGGSSPGERHRCMCKLIILPQESPATSMNARHGRGPIKSLTLLIQLLLLLSSPKTLDTHSLTLIG
jgi:hypothetical protein